MLVVRKSLSYLFIFTALLSLALPVFAQTAGAVELVGVVEAMTLDTITVNGQEIVITGAELNTALEVGALVKIEGTLNPDGSISARQVSVVAAGVQPGEAELIGVLERFDSSTLVVNGLTIDVSGAELGTGLAVGQMVKVHAAWVNGGWVAREVQLYTPADNTPGMADEFEITGTLESVGDGSIVVAGQTIVTTGAEIKSVLVVGVQVKVHASLVNGVLVAREVENAIGDDGNFNSNNNGDDSSNANDNANSNLNSNDNGDDSSNENQAGSTQISAQQAIDIVLAIYPNTSIIEIKLDDKFGGTLVWEIKTSHGLELNIDAQTGVILTIEDRHSSDDGNANFNSNNNGDDGGSFNNNSNQNSHNDNHDDDHHDDDDHSDHDD